MDGVRVILSCVSPYFLVHGVGDIFNKRFGGFVFSNAIGLTAVAAFILAARRSVEFASYVALSSLILFFVLWVINNLRYTAEWIRANHQETPLRPRKRVALLALGVTPPIYAGILIGWYIVAFNL